ncbi:MAG: hypothetical protein KA116_08325 [Proteobacteria bacterium]|nr:hypothetical protein [Pseudomonadota bacterium]
MKNVAISLLSLCVMGVASGETLKVNVDKGELRLSFDANLNTEKFSYSKKPGCDSEVTLSKKAQTMTLDHVNPNKCPSGATLNLSLPLKSDVEISHGGGMIVVKDSSALLDQVSRLEANTLGGMIETSDSRLVITSQYGPAAASFVTKHEAPRVFIKLTGGLISFR